ncbi:hypothetical protein ACQP00_39305 [Dactylosporangium sp. CS-047395]
MARPRQDPLIRTAGHGARTLDAFLRLLTAADVHTLVDEEAQPSLFPEL